MIRDDGYCEQHERAAMRKRGGKRERERERGVTKKDDGGAGRSSDN